MPRPYADSAHEYKRAGWTGPVPLGLRGKGPQKAPPPGGFTGWAGKDPSGPDIQEWAESWQGEMNIGLHLQEGLYVLDVDAHSGKPAIQSMRALTGSCGPLPATWSSTGRGEASDSRQYFFRAQLPDGRVWQDHPGAGLDSLHTGHRYAMVWPSVHPKTGQVVHWYDPEGILYEGIPKPDEMAELPQAWVIALSQPGEPLEGSAAGSGETREVLERFRQESPACRRVTEWQGLQLDRIAAATDGGALHDPGPLYSLVSWGIEGHAGVREVLIRHRDAYVQARMRLRAESQGSASADWWRMVRGAVGKKLQACGGELVERCGCGHTSGQGPEASGQTLVEQQKQRPDLPDEPSETEPAKTLKDFVLKRSQIHQLPRPVPLIKGVLNQNSDSWLIGASGDGKSFVALDWACHVATGRDWNGHRTTQGDVLYVVAEGASGINQRLAAWERTYEPVGDALSVIPMAVQAVEKVSGSVRMSARWRELVDYVAETKPRLVILDTQARMSLGLNENDNGEMGQFIAAVSRLREVSGACVLVVHHTGRNGGDARGASAIDGAQDAEWKVERIGERSERKARLTCEKSKDGQDGQGYDILLDLVELGIDEDGDPVTSLVVVPTLFDDVEARPRLDYEENLVGNIHEVAAVMQDERTLPDGETLAGLLAKVNEIRKERARGDRRQYTPMAKSSLTAALYAGDQNNSSAAGLMQRGLVTRVGPGGRGTKWAWTDRLERFVAELELERE